MHPIKENSDLPKGMFYTPTNNKDFISPFGPTIGYYKLSSFFVDTINNQMSENLKDLSSSLAGKVKQELAWTQGMLNLLLDEVKNFVFEYVDTSLQRSSYGKLKLDLNKMSYKLDAVDAWFVRQYETEYNPIHIHGGMYSCVGYLKLPEGIVEQR